MTSGGNSGRSEWFGGYGLADDTILGRLWLSPTICSLLNPAIMNFRCSSVTARSSFSYFDYKSRTNTVS
jgi:hypothetical protein